MGGKEEVKGEVEGRGRVGSGCWQEICRDKDGEVVYIIGIRIPVVDNGIDMVARIKGLTDD